MCLFSGAWLRLLFCFFKFALSFFRFAIIRIWSTKVNFVIECIVRTWIFHCLVLIFCFQVTQIQHNINILQVTLTVSKKFVLLFYFTLIVDELTICHWNITDKEILYATKIFENIFFGCWFLCIAINLNSGLAELLNNTAKHFYKVYFNLTDKFDMKLS